MFVSALGRCKMLAGGCGTCRRSLCMAPAIRCVPCCWPAPAVGSRLHQLPSHAGTAGTPRCDQARPGQRTPKLTLCGRPQGSCREVAEPAHLMQAPGLRTACMQGLTHPCLHQVIAVIVAVLASILRLTGRGRIVSRRLRGGCRGVFAWVLPPALGPSSSTCSTAASVSRKRTCRTGCSKLMLTHAAAGIRASTLGGNAGSTGSLRPFPRFEWARAPRRA